MTMPRNPSVLGGELLAKWFYQATQNASEAAGRPLGPPWDVLAESSRAILHSAGNEVIGQMVAAGFLSDQLLRKTEIPTNVRTVLPKQVGNRNAEK